jgi:hypothetical protein
LVIGDMAVSFRKDSFEETRNGNQLPPTAANAAAICRPRTGGRFASRPSGRQRMIPLHHACAAAPR